MKINIILLILTNSFNILNVVSGQEAPEPPVLESRWDLFTPELFFCSDGADFLFRFGMSDIIEEYMIKFDMFRGEECDIDIWNNLYLKPEVVYDQAPPGDGNRVRQMLVSLKPDINLLSRSPIYTVSEDGVTGTLFFCVKATIYTQDLAAMINFKEFKYAQETVIKAEVRKLEVNMNSMFESSSQDHRRLALDCSNGVDVVFENWWNITVDENGETVAPNVTVVAPVDPYDVTYDNVDTEPEPEVGNEPDGNTTSSDDDSEPETGGGLVSIIIAPENVLDMSDGSGASATSFTENLNFLVEAYACDENNVPKVITALEQGDTIRICIKPDAEATAVGLYMNRIDSTLFTMPDVEFIQYAVEVGQPDFYGMSKVDCSPGSSICIVESVMRAEFFASSGFVNVNGIAILQLGSSNSQRRQLRNEYDRELQNRENKDIGRFSISFPITTYQETVTIRTSSPSSTQSFLLIILSFTLILASSVLIWIRDVRRLGTNSNDVSLKRGLTETLKTTASLQYDDDDYCNN